MDLSSMQGLFVVVGPIILAVVIAWAMFANRKKSSPRDIARTEAATRENYDAQDREDKTRSNGGVA